jgi:hypothetical protein
VTDQLVDRLIAAGTLELHDAVRREQRRRSAGVIDIGSLWRVPLGRDLAVARMLLFRPHAVTPPTYVEDV